MRPASALFLLAAMTAELSFGAARAAQDNPPPAAAGRDDAYATCMRLARTEPAKGLEIARAWQKTGGGTSAKHCAAIAQAGLGDFAAAAETLESLAWELPDGTPDRVRAQLLAQAGQIWMNARQPGKANALLTTATELAPTDVEIRIDRAMALAATGRYQDAIIDLSGALLIDSKSIDALVLRASAFRHTGRPERAMEDVERALALDPNHPEALLERGLLRQHFGDEGGARVDWQKIVELHPKTPAAAAARRKLGAPTKPDPSR